MPVRPPVPCPSRVLPSSRRSLRPQAPDETPEVTREDQQRINAFGRLNNQLHELQAELEGKKARRRRATTRASAARRSPLALAPRPPRGWAHPLPRRAQKLMENLEEAENELLVSDDQETGYVLGECFVRLPNEEAETRLFAEPLIKGVIQHREAIDEHIKKHCKNWDFNRIAVVDRNIMRLAIYEMLHRQDIPPVVSINEAVDIAKKFSTEDSGKFVNGILDKVRGEILRPARNVK